jgi:hypothetical protein
MALQTWMRAPWILFRFGVQHSPGIAKAQGPKMQGRLHKVAKLQVPAIGYG